MDAHDRRSVIRGSRQHARELGAPHALRQGLGLLVELGEQPLVVFLRRELEELDRLSDILRQRGRKLDFFDQPGTLAQDRLSLVLVVPETGFARDLIDLADIPFELRDVKDAPLAHRRAS